MRTNTGTLLSSSNGGDLESAVRGRSWEWLRPLCARWNIEAHLVDAGGRPVDLWPGEADAARPDNTPGIDAPSLQAAISAVLHRQPAQSLTIEGVRIVCAALSARQPQDGILVLMRSAAAPAQPQQVRQLETVAQWLGPAIAAHLQSGTTEQDDSIGRVSSLVSVLDAAAVHSSDRELIAAFADALAIWYDLELTGYVEVPGGRFVREVSLPGADPSAVPAVIVPDDLPGDLLSSTITRFEPDRLRVDDAEGAYVMRVDGGNLPAWLLLMRPVGATLRDVTPVGVYGRLLEQWLSGMTARFVNLLVGRVAGMLFGPRDDYAAAAERALAELRKELRLESAHVMIVSNTGALLLDAGTASPDRVRDSRGMTLTFALGDGVTLSLSASHGSARHVSPVERRAIESVAELFQLWGRHAVASEPAPSERRRGYRRLDEAVDRAARQALARGESVVVAVLKLAESATADATAKIATGIRSQLRPWDIAGVLRDREIGFLLHDTSPEQARHVINRIRSFVEVSERVAIAALGLATRTPGSAGDNNTSSLVQEARDRGLERNVA